MAIASRRPRISSRARRTSGVDGLGMLQRSIAAVMTFWLARLKTGGLVPCVGGLNVRWRGVPSSNGRLVFRIRCDSPIDMEALVGRIIAVIGRVGVWGTKIVIQWVHVRSSISAVVVATSDRGVLRSRALRRVPVLGSGCGCYEVEGRTWMVPRKFFIDVHASSYRGSILLGNRV
jgi:hypothetical protein